MEERESKKTSGVLNINGHNLAHVSFNFQGP